MFPRVKKYWKSYKWSDIFAIIKNSKRPVKKHNASAHGFLVVITGATSGIGYATAKKYASQGADLICINRNKEKSDQLQAELEGEYKISCSYILADLSRLDHIIGAIEQLEQIEQPIDVLIHNAGLYLTKQVITKDGLDTVFAVHHVAPFLINYALLERFKEQGRGRIIFVGSEGHRFSPWGIRLDDLSWKNHRYSGSKSYGVAKTAQLQMTLVLQELLQGRGIQAFCMHPGAVHSGAGKDNGRLYRWYKRHILDKILLPTEIAAEALYYLGLSPEVAQEGGRFFHLTTLEKPAPPAVDRDAAYKLWEATLELPAVGDWISSRESGVESMGVGSPVGGENHG